ncbi:MAG: DUF3499 family protein [Actinomycetota bacterium]|nr:DUF3499 family protein [Actinomycetota bacterium]MDG2121466.1 DUF3499 family protein [Actinomycetota bacterium]
MTCCARSTCGDSAVLSLRYNSKNCSVWITEMDAESGDALALCQKHVDSLRVPIGWSMHDERDGTARLWTGDVEAKQIRNASKKHVVRRQTTQSGKIVEIEELQLFPTSEIVDDVPTQRAVITSKLIPGAVVYVDSQSSWLGKGSPLLERAFRSST